MNKTELIAKVAEVADLTKKDAEKAVNAIFGSTDSNKGVIIDAVAAGDKVQIIGFGSFESVERAARTGRNPQTGEEVQIAAKTAPKFKPGKRFEDAMPTPKA